MVKTRTEQQISHFSSFQSIWFTQIWRLTRWYLFISRCRVMTLIMLIIFLLGYFLVLAVQLLVYEVSNPATVAIVRSGFSFPTTLIVAEQYLSFIGPLLLCILASTVIGSEYSLGIQRQLLSRGLGRFQVMTAQIIAMAIIACMAAGFTLLLSTLIGIVLGPVLGASLPSLTPQNWLGLVFFLLSTALYLFIYMLIAILMATLGHSLIAGLAFSLGTILLEGVITNVLGFFSYTLRGQPLGNILGQIDGWFPSGSGSTIIAAASHMMLASSHPVDTIVLVQAVAAILLYCIILIAGSYLFYISRDITE